MSLKQTDHAYGRKQQPTDYSNGVICAAVLEYDFPVAFTASTDVLELGLVPGNTRVIGATIIGEGVGAITATVGLLTGEAGESDDDRELSGTNIFTAQSVDDTEKAATKSECLAIERADIHRGLGMTLSGDVAAGAGKITVVLEYIF